MSLLSPLQAAEYLRLDNKEPLRTLAYYRRKGDLVGVRIGRRINYRVEDLEKFVAGRVQTGPLVLPPPEPRGRRRKNHVNA